jgi:hypothetical protein
VVTIAVGVVVLTAVTGVKIGAMTARAVARTGVRSGGFRRVRTG